MNVSPILHNGDQPPDVESNEPAVGGGADLLHPAFERLRSSLMELEAQMRTPTATSSPEAETLTNTSTSQLQEAHARIANMVAEREALNDKLTTALRELSNTMDVVQKQRVALLDSRIATDRLEASAKLLRKRADHYQDTVARLLNLPPRDIEVRL